VTLADSIAEALPELRREAEALMVDTCTITRAGTGPGTINETTGAVIPPSPSTVYEGPCRVQRPGTSAAPAAESGGYAIGVGTLFVQLPISATGIKRNDVWTLTVLGPETDPDLLGVDAKVEANLTKTHATKRTLICEEAT
jgi:hypothetical protein